jgi:hypothetical protein
LNIVIGHGCMFTNWKSSRRGHRFLWTFQPWRKDRLKPGKPQAGMEDSPRLKTEGSDAKSSVWSLQRRLRTICHLYFVSLVIIAEYELRAICSLCICAWSSQAHSNNSFESDTGINDHSIPFIQHICIYIYIYCIHCSTIFCWGNISIVAFVACRGTMALT